MEVFAVAHEYGHHLLKHGLADSSVETADLFGDEHDADGFARLVSIVIDSEEESLNPYARSGVGAILMLGSLDLVTRTKAVLRSGLDQPPPRRRHPPLADRIQRIVDFDRLMPDEIRPRLADLRRYFMSIKEIIWRAACIARGYGLTKTRPIPVAGYQSKTSPAISAQAPKLPLSRGLGLHASGVGLWRCLLAAAGSGNGRGRSRS